jgi:NAD(P)-dependent dehydrogenase (short-subunit alcohol dehydrogenase family)
MHLTELFDLTGRSALVTGGGRGIGRHIAIGLAEAGADVAVASRKLVNCEETAAAIASLGRRGIALEADVGDADSVAALADRAAVELGGIDVLVNNAGVIWGAPTLEYPIEGWDKVFDVNVRGLWLLTQRVARQMKERGGGSILHISSISGLRGADEEAEPAIAYSASKGAVHALTRDLAVKLAPHGIRVNAIAPGPFDTAMLDHVRHDEDELREFLKQVPMRRYGGEDDIKGAAVFFASEASRFVTGQTLAVDGGMISR